MDFIFNIRKAIAAAGYLCQKSGGSIDMLKLIKMLYSADRKAIVRWRRPITGDRFFSLDHGPIVSRIYDLIKGLDTSSHGEAWQKVFERKPLTNTVRLIGEVNTDPLSRLEMEALDAAYDEFISLEPSAVIQRAHDFPEWQHPHGSSIKIDPSEILMNEGVSEDEIDSWKQEITDIMRAKAHLEAK